MYQVTTILLAGLMLLSGGAQAQEKLSLADAVSLGLSNNFDVEIENKRIEKSELNNTIGEAGFLPSFTLGTNPRYARQNTIKAPFPTQTTGVIVNGAVDPSLTFSWVLFDGFKAHINKRRLQELERETQGNAAIVITNTLETILLAYYGAVLEKERLQIFEENLDLSRERYRLAELKLDLGSAATSDLLLDEGNYLTDSANLISQQLRYRNALRTLNLVLAVPNPDQQWTLTDQLALDAVAYDFATLQDKMLSNNNDLRKQYIHQAVLQQEINLARAGRYPTLSLNASTNRSYQNFDLSGATFFTGTGFETGPEGLFTGEDRSMSVGLSLTFNLFNGGKINRAIQRTLIDQEIGQVETDKLKATLSKDLAQSHDQYMIRRTLYGINQRKQDAAETNLRISASRFEQGTINTFDYRTVQIAKLQASIDELQSAYDLLESKVAIMRLTGGLLEEYQTAE